jgi:hypothetical protein
MAEVRLAPRRERERMPDDDRIGIEPPSIPSVTELCAREDAITIESRSVE